MKIIIDSLNGLTFDFETDELEKICAQKFTISKSAMVVHTKDKRSSSTLWLAFPPGKSRRDFLLLCGPVLSSTSNGMMPVSPQTDSFVWSLLQKTIAHSLRLDNTHGAYRPIHDNLTFTPTAEVFSTVELWTYHNDALASFVAPDAFLLKKRSAINCIAQQPWGREFRHKYGAVWMDFVIRCAFNIPPKALEDAFCHISILHPLHRHQPEETRSAKQDISLFMPPMMWFCFLWMKFCTFPSFGTLYRRPHRDLTRRTLFINLFAQPNERLPSAETLRARLATHHPALVDQVVFVETHVPGTHETHEHLLQAMNWDAFLRWQGECQYAFSLDTDEFVQLYSSKELGEGQPRHRVDVKQFIAEHLEKLEKPKNVAHMVRLRFSREKPASEEEPLLGAFLARAARWEGNIPQLGDWRAHSLLSPPPSASSNKECEECEGIKKMKIIQKM
ncbi:hypothetical protein QOT17_022767 [Balamuthia mandrillaris]